MFVSRMVSQWCQNVWILWYSYVCVQDGLSVMSNCMNIVIFFKFVTRMVSQWCQTVWIFWYSYFCIQDGLSDVKLYEYCDILMLVSRMVSQWCQTVWILWYSYVCVQDGLPVLSNCTNIVILLCLYPGWSQWCQTVWILWYSYVCVQDGLPVMSNCMNIVIFLCLYPGWSLGDVKLYEYCDILMFVSRMVSQFCQTVWILWYYYVCIQDGLSDVKLYEYCDILMFVSRMVSQWCQTVWILWYSYVFIQDGLPVMSNCMNIVIFLCLYPGWSLSDVKLYEYCDILMFVSTMVSQWCQTVWILWYSFVCIQDGLPVMSNCMNIVIFLCLYPGWSLCDVKLYEYCNILMFVSRMV